MLSTLTLATLETRVKNMLSASAPAAHWATASIDEAIAVALEEYSRARPLPAVAVLASKPAAREVSLVALTTLINVVRVWFPYTSTLPEDPPAWIDFDFWFDAGVPKLLLHVPSVPDGTKDARLWVNQQHTLKDLNAAAATSFQAGDDGLFVWGACGFACLQRSTELDETTVVAAVSTPNYGALAELFLQRFKKGLRISSRGTVL